MKILAISTDHNSTVAYFENETIRAVIGEEKFTNVKNDDSFPINAVNWIIKTYNICSLDYVVICGISGMVIKEQNKIVLPTYNLIPTQNKIIRSLIDYVVRWLHFFGYDRIHEITTKVFHDSKKLSKRRKIVEDFIKIKLPVKFNSCLFVDHHECHAFGAYYGLKKKDKPALVFTLDGMGDFSCGRIYLVENDSWKLISNISWKHSIGGLYGKVTALMGMKPLQDEYKVMGLAPYAMDKNYYLKTKEKLFDGLIWLDETGLGFKSKYPTNLVSKYLEKKIAYERFDNIAGALQHTLEDLVLHWIKNAINKTGIRTIFTGGGVFMNIRLNKRIQELDEVEEAYFMPSCGDESLPIGAVYKIYIEKTSKEPAVFNNIYWGMFYTNEEVREFIARNKLEERYEIHYCDDIEKEIVKLLAEGRVVARLKGPCEWGARSLGNRAILARPDKLESFYEVNDRVKMRDFWMPFAPSLLDKYAKKYIKNPKNIEAPYMITAFDSTEEGKDKFRAAIHQRDKTLRPQIVTKEVNPSYYYLIEEFYQNTGIGGILNTSFNLHGYPLVGTLEQALFTIDNCYLEYLAMENWLLRKKKVSNKC